MDVPKASLERYRRVIIFFRQIIALLIVACFNPRASTPFLPLKLLSFHDILAIANLNDDEEIARD